MQKIMTPREIKQLLAEKKSRILNEVYVSEVKLKEGLNTNTGMISIEELTKILEKWL